MNKKNLDRLFQEKFKEFEVKPKDYNWDKIQSKLKEDDKKIVVIPIWIKFIGVAASLILMLGLGLNMYINNNTKQPKVVNTVNNPVDTTNQKTTNTTRDTKPTIKNNSTLELDNNKNITNSESETKLQQQKLTKISNKVVVNTNQETKSERPKNQNTIISSNKSNKNNLSINTQNSNSTNNYASNTNSGLKKPDKIKVQDLITVLDTTLHSTVTTNSSETIKLDEDKKENSIEEAIAKEELEEIIEEENNYNRWSVNINAAPVYYNSFGNGSHIDEQFNKNDKSGAINTGYGVKVGYALNNKIKVRTGINKLNLSYNTNNVIVYQNINNNPKTLRNLNLNTINNNLNINVISGNESFLQTPNLGFVKSVSLNQELSYYEIPLEFEYTFINSKFSINLIGGFSTFLLENNNIISEFDGEEMEIGKANNINNLSFTSNLGVGFNYNFSKAIQFNLEPTFKYQINAYENTPTNFNPYIIGLYTGLSYKF